jgi:hypothetical protein
MDDELDPRIARHLMTRELFTATRHALDLQQDADAVSITVTLDKHGLSLDVTYSRNGTPFAGFGQ